MVRDDLLRKLLEKWENPVLIFGQVMVKDTVMVKVMAKVVVKVMSIL